MKKTYPIILYGMLSFLVLGTNAKAQTVTKDKPYKFGDFIIVSPDNMNIDYIVKGKPLVKKISKGDTLYEDYKCLILGDLDIFRAYYKHGIYKKYTIPYKFSAFEVPVFRGKLAPPNFKTDTAAWLYRTQIREQCKSEGINFAGHFTIVKWGCGSNCLDMAIVDRINGKISYSKVLTSNDEPFYTIAYQKNSNIVIMDDWLMNDYKGYIFCSEVWDLITAKWENTKFRVLSVVKFNDHPANP
jgi:hypothetical protein